MKLCGFRISNYHNKVRLALLEKGIDHEEDASCTPRQTFVHLPLVSLATKLGYGRDVLEDVPGLEAYLAMLGEPPAFARVRRDQKAARAAAQKK